MAARGRVKMRSPNDLWEALGSVAEEELVHVLTKIFTVYEQLLQVDPENREAKLFFRNLDNALEATQQCNLNRR
jgi:hypothetical protein